MNVTNQNENPTAQTDDKRIALCRLMSGRSLDCPTNVLSVMVLMLVLFLGGPTEAAPASVVPGVVIDHSPKTSGLYIGSPSLVILPDGKYLASHDFFGPQSDSTVCATTVVFCSTNRGATWQPTARVKCAFWSDLFVHDGAVYLMGPTKEYGDLVIRRSVDDGRTWTDPGSPATGLLATGEWHTAPVPVVIHDGRLWRAVENAEGGTQWGKRFRAGMLSIPVNADLLNATNWTFSNFLPRNPNWLGGKFGGWLEGNAVVAPDGGMVNVLRVDAPGLPEKAAIVHVSVDGKTATFDPAADFIDFPGGAKKFTIRQDTQGGGYWTIASVIPDRDVAVQKALASGLKPASVRNTLALLHSTDLRHWQTRCILLHHPDVEKHGFQYVDWQFEGKDIIAVCRTAYDDATGGAHRAHDANYLTFYRWSDFRALTMVDSVPLPSGEREEKTQ